MDRSVNRVWRHFLMLTGMAVILISVGSATLLLERGASTTWSAALLAGILGTPPGLFVVLPILVGIAVGGERFERDSAKAIWSLIAGTAAFMILLDVAGPVKSARTIARERVAYTESAVEAFRTGSDWSSVRAIPTLAAAIRGELPNVDEQLEVYPFGHDRLVAAAAFFKLGFLLLPLCIAGVVAGTVSWLDRRVIFRTPSDARLARIVVAWTVSPIVLWSLHALTASAQFKVLFVGQPLPLLLMPYVPVLVMAVLGIRRATGRVGEEHPAGATALRVV